MNITLSDIGGIFDELGDENQVRLLAFLAQRVRPTNNGWDKLWYGLRSLAEDVTGFFETDAYADMLRAEDLVPVRPATADAEYQRDRDAHLRYGLDRASIAWTQRLERKMREAA